MIGCMEVEAERMQPFMHNASKPVLHSQVTFFSTSFKRNKIQLELNMCHYLYKAPLFYVASEYVRYNNFIICFAVILNVYWSLGVRHAEYG